MSCVPPNTSINTKIDGEGKRSLLKCCPIWGNREPLGSRLLLSTTPKTRDSVQKPRSIFICSPGVQSGYVNESLALGSLSRMCTCGASAAFASLKLFPFPGAQGCCQITAVGHAVGLHSQGPVPETAYPPPSSAPPRPGAGRRSRPCIHVLVSK